jgi:hypothetical protein
MSVFDYKEIAEFDLFGFGCWTKQDFDGWENEHSEKWIFDSVPTFCRT